MQYSKRFTQYVSLHHESLMEMHFERRNIHTKTTTLTTTITTTTNYHYHLFYYRQDGIHLCITQSLHNIQYSQGKCRGFSTEMRPWPKHTLFLTLTLYLYVNKRHLWATMCSGIIELKSVSAAHILLICFWTIQFSTQVNECNAVAKNFHAYFQCFAHLLYGKWFAWHDYWMYVGT